MHSIKYCNAKFARPLYEEAHEYRSPSFVALNLKQLLSNESERRVREKSAFGFVLDEQALGGMALLVKLLSQKSGRKILG